MSNRPHLSRLGFVYAAEATMPDTLLDQLVARLLPRRVRELALVPRTDEHSRSP